MIHAYTGLLGGGKTLTAVLEMLSVWRRGGYVYTNVELFPEAIKAFGRRKWGVELRDEQIGTLTPAQIPLFHRHIKRGTKAMPVLVVIDETGKYFNARRWKDNELETADFLRESRKLHIDIIFITQELEYLDKQFRMLFQYIWRFTDMKGFRVPILDRYILQKQYQAETDVKVKNHWWRKNPEIFALYDTDALVSDYAIAGEDELAPIELEKVDINETPRIRMKGFLIIIIALGILLYSLGKWYFKAKPESTNKTPVPAAAMVASSTITAPDSGAKSASNPDNTVVSYEMRVEELQSMWGLGGMWEIRTDKDVYQPGKLCRSGVVVDRDGEVVRVLQPNGRTLYVTAMVIRTPADAVRSGMEPAQVAAAEKSDVRRATVAANAVKNALTVANAAPMFAPK
jgi:hypothetical protein